MEMGVEMRNPGCQAVKLRNEHVRAKTTTHSYRHPRRSVQVAFILRRVPSRTFANAALYKGLQQT